MGVKIVLPPGVIVSKRKPGPKPVVVKPERVRSGKRARRKGHGFEREIAIELRKAGFPQACRHLEYQQGAGYDIDNAGVYDIQCKRNKRYQNASVIKEVPYREGRVRVLVTRADKMETLVVIPFDHFLEIMKK